MMASYRNKFVENPLLIRTTGRSISFDDCLN